jgi:hypothetical protein
MTSDVLATRWYPHDLSLFEDMAVIGDVHGKSDAFETLLDELDDVRIVQLGDLIDRGSDSLGAIGVGWERIHGAGGVLLPGNHEGLMLEAFDQLDGSGVVEEQLGRSWHGFDNPIDAWLSNGGGTVLQEIDPAQANSATDAARRVRATLSQGYEAYLRNAPSHHRNGDVLIVHAGVHPKAPDPEGWLKQPLTLEAANSRHPHYDHWAWTRGDFQRWSHGWSRWGAKAIVHGHTAPNTRSFADASEVSLHLDRLTTVGRICVDGGSYRNGTVAAVELREGRYRLLAAVE